MQFIICNLQYNLVYSFNVITQNKAGTGLSPEDNFGPFFSSYMRFSKPTGR